MRLGAAAVVFVVLGAVASADTITREDFRCNYSRKFECSSLLECQTSPIGSSYLLVPHVDDLYGDTIGAGIVSKLPSIRRCDEKGCSAVEVSATMNGAFINVTKPDGTYFLKISTVDLGKGTEIGDFVEVTLSVLGHNHILRIVSSDCEIA
ncbi:MAG: hypothetical protein Q7R30_24540 [Acidobacteriota bacterium]|nr:hypothetical protein [Acidobacteriota bacterium]